MSLSISVQSASFVITWRGNVNDRSIALPCGIRNKILVLLICMSLYMLIDVCVEYDWCAYQARVHWPLRSSPSALRCSEISVFSSNFSTYKYRRLLSVGTFVLWQWLISKAGRNKGWTPATLSVFTHVLYLFSFNKNNLPQVHFLQYIKKFNILWALVLRIEFVE